MLDYYKKQLYSLMDSDDFSEDQIKIAFIICFNMGNKESCKIKIKDLMAISGCNESRVRQALKGLHEKEIIESKGLGHRRVFVLGSYFDEPIQNNVIQLFKLSK